MDIWRLATCGHGLHDRSSIPFDYLKWSKSRSRALSLLGQRWAESCRHRWRKHRRIHDDNTVCSRRKLDGYWVCHAAFYYVILDYIGVLFVLCAHSLQRIDTDSKAHTSRMYKLTTRSLRLFHCLLWKTLESVDNRSDQRSNCSVCCFNFTVAE